VVRNRIDTNKQASSGALRLVCATEMESACTAIAAADGRVTVTVEPAGVTADRLTKATPAGLDGWLAPGPWPAMVMQARQSAGLPVLITRSSAPLARTRVGFAIWVDRAAVLAKRCGRPVDWVCLGDAGGHTWSELGGPASWGDVKVALPDPRLSATGLLALGAGTAALLGSTDLSTSDLDGNEKLASWEQGLRRAAVATDLRLMLATGSSLVDAVIVLEQAATPAVADYARNAPVTVIYPAPVAVGEVVLGRVDGSAADRLAAIVTGRVGVGALIGTGWSPALSRPGPNSLPAAGLLAALRSRWTP
jgi:hypothetical protein